MIVVAIGTMTVMATMNPLMISVLILILSLIITPAIYKSMPESWIPFVLVITFSTGMMILFLYATSLTSNEINKSKNMMITTILVTVMMMQKSNPTQTSKQSETFSTKMMMMITAVILLMTMMALSIQGYTPNQSMSSSF